VVETTPISGVVRFAIIAGPAIANTWREPILRETGACISEYEDHAVFGGEMRNIIQP